MMFKPFIGGFGDNIYWGNMFLLICNVPLLIAR